MFDLVYNIDFEIISFVFAVVLYIEIYLCYPMQTRKNQIFRVMGALVIITEGLDMLSAVTITYGPQIPTLINIIVNSGYFMSGLVLCYSLHYYIENAIILVGGKSVLINLNRIILIILEISIVINIFFGYYFSISASGKYIHGPLYLLLHFFSCWFVLCGSLAMIINKKTIKRNQLFSSFLFILLYFVSVIIQTFFFPNTLIIMAAVSIMLIIAAFSLETPDYIQLQKTLKELTETKQKLENANKKYYDLAYLDLMTGLKNRTAYNFRLKQLEISDYKENMIILIADINSLKLINDNYGHLIGDEAIINVAKILVNNFQNGYQCYRIGGDEFTVIANGVRLEEFIKKLNNFKEDILQKASEVDYPFSVAIGYEPSGNQSLSEAIKKSDQNMYLNKQKLKEANK